MRTTIDIDDALLRAAEARAARERTTLKAVVEQALRELLSDPKRGVAAGPPIPVLHGQGMQPGVDLTDNAALEDLMNARPDGANETDIYIRPGEPGRRTQ